VLDNDPHAQARAMIQRVQHPTAGEVRVLGSPMKLSRTPAAIYRHPPRLGEHGEEIRAELDNIRAPVDRDTTSE
jgi:crotonobetainyl-CoA:carnitine CoA-transferase CaiB-like acyl-CoA transferase